MVIRLIERGPLVGPQRSTIRARRRPSGRPCSTLDPHQLAGLGVEGVAGGDVQLLALAAVDRQQTARAADHARRRPACADRAAVAACG